MQFPAIAKLLTLAALAAGSAFAHADSAYPDRPIRMIIPYAPGGSLDPIGRVLGEELARRLKQPVVVENVAGANGMLGGNRVAKAAPDGYTLLIGITSNVSLAPLVTPEAQYQASDFDAIGMVGTSGLVLVARPDLPAADMAGVLALARQKPGGLSYGIPGSGSLYHLAMEAIKSDTQTNIVAVPYRGAGQASIDVMGGQIDVALLGLPAMLPHIASQKMKALAVMSKQRDVGDKSIPSASETAGLEGIDYTIWTGVFAPKGTPEPVRQRLHEELQAILRQPEVIENYRKMGVEVAPAQTMAEFAAFIASQTDKLKSDIARTKFNPGS
ncbi:tripartite tricarboxylate transporter substrate binding protein [Achromobacter denitrificans]|uniref:Bug family tripartite tricarboxylate transporter substrate binding protein n=1 Tax=Achromobacter denitrificans TaxID=32002 RepID=UPI0016637012|nr:tripartite tricarboxylate transporter substrate binding protein [Achromobacter denitrificans]MDF3942079.1 tripartite tricarboxylate transporter substrate binding protein [Achromobacter denitrificans]GFN29620.1 exported protein [Achromobacter denitrificans]